ncbi:aldehyde dehydrogenase [Besnoitia besnoiti]|uniref:Aldehyde dehydrogenase n=1 Tax=Besnoitia besnoiti TaxID=94643 RepID=A0A2A9MEF9_BESBE|nr:aldehyde dehydrogenase [Besnoitia besnoiti]PFH33772.1 aldehyde dehydrogenase [Besnoitia besnoiti]
MQRDCHTHPQSCLTRVDGRLATGLTRTDTQRLFRSWGRGENKHVSRVTAPRRELTRPLRVSLCHAAELVLVSVVTLKPEDIETRLFINGKFVEATSGSYFEDVNPATEEVICKVQEASKEDVDKAVEAAAKAFPSWSLSTSASTRALLLHKLASLVEKHADELALIESLDSGKPISSIHEIDIAGVIRILHYYAGWADKIVGKTIPVDNPDEYFCYTRKEPVGVVAGIVPWNYPLYLLVLKLAPALTCGCTVVIKTSEKTPLSALRLAHLIKEAGFPPGVANILSGFGPSVGDALASHPKVDKISFTGSTLTGRKIAAAALVHLKRVTLELGGKSALIVCADADLDRAAEVAFNGLFPNSGQCCVASSRVFVQESVHDEFLAHLKTFVREHLHLLCPQDRGCTQGPLVDKIQFERVMKYIHQGISEGATVAAGGTKKDGKGFWVMPTIFADVTDDMTIAKEEIFGPVICLLKFRTADEAVDRANESHYGLGAGICTKDIGLAYHCANRLKAGNVFINCYNKTDIAAPFGGFKQSGYGREGGEEGLFPYLEIKAVYSKVDPPHEVLPALKSRQ